MDKVIPEDVSQFILQHIDSIAQIEGLLLFYGDHEKEWNAQAIAQALFISEAQAAYILTQLSEQGFIARTGDSYHYHPKNSKLKGMVERTAALYRQYLIPVTNLIHSKPESRVQQFANAFKLRKD